MFIDDIFYTAAGLVSIIGPHDLHHHHCPVIQINSCPGDFTRSERRANTHLSQTAELPRQIFTTLLAEGGSDRKGDHDCLVDQGCLTQYQTNFVFIHSSHEETESK